MSMIIFQVEKNSLYFKGIAEADKKVYEVNMKLLKEIDPEKTKYQVRPRCIEFALEKAEEGPYWERLLAEKTKQHWLKVCQAFDLLLNFLELLGRLWQVEGRG